MSTPINRPSADPLDDIDREQGGVDDMMARQDRADLPGSRSDIPADPDVYDQATREVVEGTRDPDQARLDDDREDERVADGDPDGELDDPEIAVDGDVIASRAGRGADDDDPIEETERMGDDSRTTGE